MTDPDNFEKEIGRSVSPSGKLQTYLFQTCKEEEQTQKFIRSDKNDLINMNYGAKFINEYQCDKTCSYNCDPKNYALICMKPTAFSNFEYNGNKVELVPHVSLRHDVMKNVFLTNRYEVSYEKNDSTFLCEDNSFLTYLQMTKIVKNYGTHTDGGYTVTDGGFYIICSKLKNNNIVKVLTNIGYSDPITPVGTASKKKCPDNYYAIGIQYQDQKVENKDRWLYYFTAPSIRLVCKEIQIIPKYTASVQVAVFTESNNWDSPTTKSIEDQECLFNVSYSRCESCDISNTVQGISFQKDNQISFLQRKEYMRTIDINDNGDFVDDTESQFIESTAVTRSDPVLSSILHLLESNLDFRDSKFLQHENSIIALSFPHTTNLENRNVVNAGLIVILEKVTGEWKIKDEIYGKMTNQQFGLKKMTITDSNTLQVVSDQFQFGYLYKRLVSKKPTPNQYRNALYRNKTNKFIKRIIALIIHQKMQPTQVVTVM